MPHAPAALPQHILRVTCEDQCLPHVEQELKVDTARDKAKEQRGGGTRRPDSCKVELWCMPLEGVPEPARQAVEYLHVRYAACQNPTCTKPKMPQSVCRHHTQEKCRPKSPLLGSDSLLVAQIVVNASQRRAI